jgi:hypothetical protein
MGLFSLKILFNGTLTKPLICPAKSELLNINNAKKLA